MFTLIRLMFLLLEKMIMCIPVITFTSGWISIRRGKILRKYTPGYASTARLSQLMLDGPTNHKTTNRSSIYTWYGLSTLDDAQRGLYRYYQRTIKISNTDEWLQPYTAKTCCAIAGIHSVLLELLTPCPDGKAKSRCYTCDTAM